MNTRAILLLCLSSTVKSFAPPVRSRIDVSQHSESSLRSTLAPLPPTQGEDHKDEPPPSRGGISMPIDELANVLGGRGRAQLVWDCYAIGIDASNYFGSVINLDYDDYESIQGLLPSCRRLQTLGGEALDRLEQLYPAGGQVEGGVASLSHISTSNDGTTKLLLKLSDGLEVETVIIPWEGARSTLCISSQVGCRQGCKFCATGKMGMIRSLTSDEILAQMFFAKKICRWNDLPEVSNVVFMGMGEPADNVEAVTTAAKILTKNELFQLSASKVTISTVAPSPDAFRQLSKVPCVLAWSVHAANDQLRQKLVPTTKYSMVELRQGFIEALLTRPANLRTAMLEVALMGGVNDSIAEADELAEFAKVIVDQVPGCKLIVNLIPFNDIGNTTYEKPRKESVQKFQRRLWEFGVHAHVRKTRGDDALAACGQLATQKKKLSIKKNPLSAEPVRV